MVPADHRYPTPRGGTIQSWEDSYTKAHDLVQNMTLIEKINITTGTGWQMGLCVGNTGTSWQLFLDDRVQTDYSRPRGKRPISFSMPARWPYGSPIYRPC